MKTSPNSLFSGTFVGCSIALVVAMTPCHTVAAPLELMLQLDTSMHLDSNPFRFPDDVSLPGNLNTMRKSDSLANLELRGALIVPIESPDTKLLLSGQLGTRDQKQFNQLDTSEGNYRALYKWRLGELWQGEVARAKQNRPYQYQDGSLTDRVMVRTEETSGEIALLITPELQVPLKLSRQTVRYDHDALTANDQTNQSVDVSGRWITGTQSKLQAGFRSNITHYFNRTEQQISSLDSKYSDREMYVAADWQYSVVTRLGGRVGYLRRTYESLSGRDLSMVNTELNGIYDYSPLTKFTLTVWNRPFGTTDLNTLYSINSGTQFGVRWLATSKTKIGLTVVSEKRRNQSSPLASGSLNPSLHRTRWGGSVVHSITPELRIYADGYRESLQRGTLGGTIRQNLLRVGLEYTYENIPGVALRAGNRDRLQ